MRFKIMLTVRCNKTGIPLANEYDRLFNSFEDYDVYDMPPKFPEFRLAI